MEFKVEQLKHFDREWCFGYAFVHNKSNRLIKIRLNKNGKPVLFRGNENEHPDANILRLAANEYITLRYP